MDERIARILDRLKKVRWRRLTSFGSKHHGFRLNKPATEEAVAAFEAVHGIRLPEDYRLFLLQAGDGGAGPYYGLLSLGQWDEAVLEELPDYLARPSPLRPDMPGEHEWDQALDCPRAELFQGTMNIVHQGCSYEVLLVVTGPYRGRVVYVDLDCSGPPYFVRDAGFLAWYERWLDELLWGYDGFLFGFGLPGDEAEMVRVLACAESVPDLRQEALTTLKRIPSLQPASLAVVRAALRDPTPRVRAQAAGIVGKQRFTAARDDVRALLGDTNAGVRLAALAAWPLLSAMDWVPAAREALHDPDQQVVIRAVSLLQDAKALCWEDVRLLLGSTNPALRRQALWAGAKVQEPPDAAAIKAQLLRDPDPYVRRMAFDDLGTKRDHSRVPVLLELLGEETDPDTLCRLVRALGHIGSSQAVPALIPMTRHADAFVRMEAARALGELRDLRAIPALEALASDATKPERRDERGMMVMCNVYTVGQVAAKALRGIPRTSWGRFPRFLLRAFGQ